MVIAIANQKGGVAKTTTAANLAWLLAEEHGHHVALLDLNAQASLSAVLSYEQPACPLCDWLVDPSRPYTDAEARVTERLSLFVGSSELATAGAALLRNDIHALRDRVRRRKNPFATWIIDTPPELGPLTVAALCASGGVLIPVQVYSQAVRGLVQLFSTVDRVRGRRKDPKVLGILPTFMQARPVHHREVLQALTDTYPDLIMPAVPQSVVVQYADVARRPIVAEYPRHAVADAYRQTARILLDRVGG